MRELIYLFSVVYRCNHALESDVKIIYNSNHRYNLVGWYEIIYYNSLNARGVIQWHKKMLSHCPACNQDILLLKQLRIGDIVICGEPIEHERSMFEITI